MKKKLALLLAVLMMLGTLSACRSTDAPASAPAAGTAAESFKIGVMTGTVSQGEEEFRMAEQMKAKYGDMIVTTTYPDNFSSETETTISNILSLAADPAVKAIVICQAPSGVAAAIDKIRETRPDMLFVLGVAHEDPEVIASKADVVLSADNITTGETMIARAVEAGAKNFVHYSFPRHMSSVTTSARYQLLEENAAKNGINFVNVTAPDPTGDSGVAGTQQFILEDVPRQIADLGPDTVFYGTNCGMQEPMIKEIVKGGAIMVQQCCPSPYHAFPAALNISIPDDKKGDVDYIVSEIKAKAADANMTGRLSTWPVPINMLLVEAGVEYAKLFCEGKTNGAFDTDVVQETITKYAVGDVIITEYVLGDIHLENTFRVLCDYVVF